MLAKLRAKGAGWLMAFAVARFELSATHALRGDIYHVDVRIDDITTMRLTRHRAAAQASAACATGAAAE